MDLPSCNLNTDEDLQVLLKRLPPFNREQITDAALHKVLRHLLPYERRKMLDEILCKILSYLPGASSSYDAKILVCSLDPRTSLSIPRRLLRACPAVSLENLIKFSHVNYAVKLACEQKLSPISRLSNEILEIVLKQLSPQSGNLVKPWSRASLSVESFATIPPPPQFVYDSTQFDHFSRVCHKFLEPGRKRLFVRITVRFSSGGFEKLQNIAERPLLASSVKKFSYMIPRFYSQDRVQFEELLQAFSGPVQSTFIRQVGRERNQQSREPRRIAENHSLINSTMRKAEDQRSIIEHGRDRDCLLYALSSFRNLQQVRLMRVEDVVDTGWTAFLDRYPEYKATFRPDDWARSCEHAAQTLAWVLIKSNNEQLARFSSRFMEPRSPLIITRSLRTTISTLAERLLYLELEFVDERSHQHERMSELSELFGTVFTAAVNLQCLHVGFRRRMSAPLSLLFHNVRFRWLVHLGLHMWDLDSDELIELLRRHRNTLRSIRLRHISLKQELNEKNWEKVLRFIRGSFPNLKWISLRGISYDPQASATTHAMGGLHFAPALQPHPLQLDSDTDSDSGISNWSPNGTDGNHEAETGADHESSDPESATNDDDTDELESSEAGSINDDDENDSDLEEEHHDLSFEPSLSADNTLLANSLLQPEPERVTYNNTRGLHCECGNGYGWDDLDDNGVSVTREQWKKWEIWVKKSCSRHDHWETDG